MSLQFGRYEVESELGQGAMGKVYRAFDPLTQRSVAIKVLKEEILAQDETGDYQKRFQREARAAGSLSHPNIVTIFDVGENYFVMELLEGESLLSRIADKSTFSLDETLAVVAPIADALAYAHNKGVYHRDVKPANIMVLPDGRPVITDFGLAHLESTVMTTAGQFLGSPSYMAPEQITGEGVGPSADLFSLSVVTYEMLTGNKPFPGDNVTSVIYRVVHSDPMSPHAYRPDLPDEYHDVFQRALAKDPARRFGSFSELISALNLEQFEHLEIPGETTIVAGSAPSPPDVGTPEEQDTADLSVPDGRTPSAIESQSSVTGRKRPESKPSPVVLAAAAGFVALAVIAAFLLMGSPQSAPPVLLETLPDEAEVWIDGELAGTSPLELASLAFGSHDVRITKEGFLPVEDEFELASGDDPGSLFFGLQPATISLFLESTPDASSVTIDGEEVGETPLDGFELEPGQHEISIERRGYETWRSTLVAQAGESVNLDARLRARPRPPKPPAPEPAAAAAEESEAPAEPEPEEEWPEVPVQPEVAVPQPGELVELSPTDKPPEKISGRGVTYPKAAKRLNQQGRVTLALTVTEEGVPTDLEIVESAGAILDQAVLDAVEDWRYTPAERLGVKVKVRLRIRQTFRLGR